MAHQRHLRPTLAAAALLAGLGALAPAAAAAADAPVRVTLDGRPIDRSHAVAVSRDALVYADLVDLVKTFDGLLVMQGPTTKVTIGRHGAAFTPGTTRATLDGKPVALPGAPFSRAGDLYVPLRFFATRVAGARYAASPRGVDLRVAAP